MWRRWTTIRQLYDIIVIKRLSIWQHSIWHGSLCGSTWGLSGSLRGSPWLPLWQYQGGSGYLWGFQWLLLWQFLRSVWLPMGFSMALFVAVPESLWVPMKRHMAPFVAVPGVCLAPHGAPYGAPYGSLCGSTRMALAPYGAPYGAPHGSLCGSTWSLYDSLWDPQWLPLWQYLGSACLPMGPPMAPFVAVPGVCLPPYGTPNGSLCGSTWSLHDSLRGSPWLPLWQYLGSACLPMGPIMAPFVAVPGVCLPPYGPPNGFLCGST